MDRIHHEYVLFCCLAFSFQGAKTHVGWWICLFSAEMYARGTILLAVSMLSLLLKWVLLNQGTAIKIATVLRFRRENARGGSFWTSNVVSFFMTHSEKRSCGPEKCVPSFLPDGEVQGLQAFGFGCCVFAALRGLSLLDGYF